MAAEKLTDDYVAGLLAKDARDSSLKYSALGLEAYRNPISKADTNKPKPNTRFLRNIIRDTDNHNAALLAKESTESKARLNQLRKDGTEGDRKREIKGGDIRSRQLGLIAAHLSGGPKKSIRNQESSRSRHRRVPPSDEEKPKARANSHRSSNYGRLKEGSYSGESDSRESRNQKRSEEGGRKRNPDSRRHRQRSRSKSPRQNERASSYRDRSPRRKRSLSPYRIDRQRSDERAQRNIRGQRAHFSMTKDSNSKRPRLEERISKPYSEDLDSDPLEDLIGPLPPPKAEVRSRGRGTTSSSFGIDSRFSRDYDPKADVAVNADEEDDWEQALEAVRDRVKWQQQGADRLLAAGFSDAEVKRWEKGGQKNEEDVTWAKKGESREWDRGKVVSGEGDVSWKTNFKLSGDM